MSNRAGASAAESTREEVSAAVSGAVLSNLDKGRGCSLYLLLDSLGRLGWQEQDLGAGLRVLYCGFALLVAARDSPTC